MRFACRVCLIGILCCGPRILHAQTAPGGKRAPAKKGKNTQPPKSSADVAPPGWLLTFSEEFEGSSLNFSKWAPHEPGNVLLNGVQTMVPEAIELSGGQAHITARVLKTGGSRTNPAYTSGVLTTFGLFAQTFGRFEIRFRMPAGRGLEPVFRLLPVPLRNTPSIDIMNALGDEPTKALFANTWGDGRTDRDYTGSYKVADLSVGFHTAAIEWDSDQIVWMVDGVERFHSYDGVPGVPMFLEVALAVGSSRAGSPNAQTQFPATLDIDYIRVFARR
jgi:beta-glucanase (GH16 family)